MYFHRALPNGFSYAFSGLVNDDFYSHPEWVRASTLATPDDLSQETPLNPERVLAVSYHQY